MRYLVDTQILLWAAVDSPRLGARVRDLLQGDAAALHFSAASIWEVAIKSALGRTDFRVDPIRLTDRLRAARYLEQPITAAHGAAVLSLPRLHNDPFNRILIAQARVEGLVLLTRDTALADYGVGIEVA